MTLVVLWGTGGQLMCAADTRLSSEAQQTITDHGAKLAVVPVRWAMTDENLTESASYTLGFAFCGSTLLANNAHAIATSCSQILHKRRTGADMPSSDLIAEIYARSGEQVTKDVNSRLCGNHIFFEGILFGYCPVRKSRRAHLIIPTMNDGLFAMKIESQDINDGDIIAIGSGCAEFLRLAEQRNAAGNGRPILELMQEIMRGDAVRDVGGFPQVAIADVGGVQFRPVLIQNPENPDQALLTINGFDISKVSSNEGFSFGLEALGIGVENIIGRNALRAKGIDPDLGPVAREVQNLASMEAAIQRAFVRKASIGLDDVYPIIPQTAVLDAWYFAATCACGQHVPYLLDPSEGKMGNPFCGNGSIVTICNKCGQRATAHANNLSSRRWRT